MLMHSIFRQAVESRGNLNMETSKKRGEHNSSITRVRPVFQQLLRRDPPDEAFWLPRLLRLASSGQPLATRLAGSPGLLLPELRKLKCHCDPVLKQRFGICGIMLEECFEKAVPPTACFLKWLIEHPDPKAGPREESRNPKIRN